MFRMSISDNTMRRLNWAVLLLLLGAAIFAARRGEWLVAVSDLVCMAVLIHIWVRSMDWDEWRGSDGATVRIKRLVHLGGYRVDLHKIVAADADYCYHTHPAKAIRIILWGGYREEYRMPSGVSVYRRWTPGKVGRVAPDFCHRIDRVGPEGSWSLWLRGPVTHDIRLVGVGWLTYCDKCQVNRSYNEVYYSDDGQKHCRGCHQSLEPQMAKDLHDEAG